MPPSGWPRGLTENDAVRMSAEPSQYSPPKVRKIVLLDGVLWNDAPAAPVPVASFHGRPPHVVSHEFVSRLYPETGRPAAPPANMRPESPPAPDATGCPAAPFCPESAGV